MAFLELRITKPSRVLRAAFAVQDFVGAFSEFAPRTDPANVSVYIQHSEVQNSDLHGLVAAVIPETDKSVLGQDKRQFADQFRKNSEIVRNPFKAGTHRNSD